MVQKVLNYIQKHHLVEINDKLIVALSGGADSVALLHFLKGIQDEYRLKLLAVHVNHGIREEAGEDEAFCKRLCEAMGVPLRCCHIAPGELENKKGMSLEEAARAQRYALLEECRREVGFDKIAVAHHANDNAETMLFQLFRGSGLKGLSGIAPMRGHVIRPFLGVTRQEILKYLSDNGLAHVEDASNQDVRYSRNRIRADIIPAAEAINASAVENMSRCAEQLKDIQAYLEEEAAAFLSRSAVCDANGAGVSVSLAALQKLPAALLREVLFESVVRVSGSRKDITFSHIEAVRALLDKDGQKEYVLPYGVTARKTYETLRIFRKKHHTEIHVAEQGECDTDRTDPEADCTEQNFRNSQNAVSAQDMAQPQNAFMIPFNGAVSLPEGGKLCLRTFPAACFGEKINNIPQNDCTKWFDCDKIRDNLMLRHRKPGDYLTVTANGGRKSLQDYLVNAKVPRDQRDELWLLADGSHILWVIGLRISMAYRVTETTENILEVHLEEKADGRESGGTDSGGRSESENS
ncbi:MAG: tRNA lysidine(34) synthetase TilS [Lachnospiraceae bacterium]|nr:tRNA lysidine(34) synthetase TilS [Lachnospiraceae bacterium]